VDLTARLKTQKKLEERYLAILARAESVEDMLKVEKQLSVARGEIEKLEGRQRYLDNQVELSTISVSFQRHRPLIAASGPRFSRAAKRAGADVINVGAALITGGIRVAGVLIPVTLLVLLPLGLIGRAVMRRAFRGSRQPAAAV
jgi:hypothetical protein